MSAWRNHLYHQLEKLSYMKDVLVDTVAAGTGGSRLSRPLLPRVQSRRTYMEALTRRLDSSFQTLTSTMNIIKSEKAIQEAEEAT